MNIYCYKGAFLLKKYCVLGDDNRSNYIRKMYIEDGVKLVSYDEADFVITPIPFSKDGIKVFGSIIDVDEFILNVKDKIFFSDVGDTPVVYALINRKS